MPSMRLGTRVAVINEKGEILLSKRSDLGTWELPGGRVDSHELIHESATREVLEETGLKVEIERVVGLYFQQGRGRMNILYRAKPIGGTLFDKTDETDGNQFFALDNLPDNLYGKFYVDHAYTDKTWLYTVASPRWQLIKLDIQLKLRWIQNLLAGRPEPKFPQFTITSVVIICNPTRDGLLLIDRELLRVGNIGKMSVSDSVRIFFPPDDLYDWQWVGLFQDTQTDTIEFIFEAVVDIPANKVKTIADITNPRQLRYVELSAQQRRYIWLLTQEDLNE